MNRDRNETIQEIRDDNSNIFFCKCCVGGVMMPATPGSGGRGRVSGVQVDPRVTSYYEDHFRELCCNRNFPDAHSIYKSGHRRDQAFEIVFRMEHVKLRMRIFILMCVYK